MIINTNLWNKIRYTLLSPVYDAAASAFAKSRGFSIEQLHIQPGEKVLIIGAGTGLDLKYLPKDANVTATDITPAMVNRIEQRNKKLCLNVKALVMDGQKLQFADSSFDMVILHLILAVIPDPVACIKEAERVLKAGGRMTVYDKFLAANENPSLVRKALNLITNFFFSDINRKFEGIISHTQLKVLKETAMDFGGNYKVYLLEK